VNQVDSASSTHKRRSQDDTQQTQEKGSSVSIEIVVIAFTALLVVIGHGVHAKMARDAQHAENDHDRFTAEVEREREGSHVFLQRICAQYAAGSEIFMRIIPYNRGFCRLVNQLFPKLAEDNYGSTLLHPPSEQLVRHANDFLNDERLASAEPVFHPLTRRRRDDR
jgi:hypothetical protein